MAKQVVSSMLAVTALLLLAAIASFPYTVHSIGVCNGVIGNDLPSPADVVKLYMSKGITAMRIYAPEANVLRALSGTGIGLIIDVPNNNISAIASSPAAAVAWVKANVQAFPGVSFKYIAVGNEIRDINGQKNILPAMKNVNAALIAAGRGGIKVSTSVQSGVTAGFPPSHGIFDANNGSHMPPIARYLASTGAPLLANIYPYFAFKGGNNPLDYALFTAPGTVVTDDNGNQYQNLFDALLDTMYSALESAGAATVPIVVSESGWPSAGDPVATTANAQTYNQNLINHVGKGTPKRAGPIEAYVFAMFNENGKDGIETEKHFGLFNPDKSPAYSINFS